MIEVRKMPPDTGLAAWNAILPERVPNPALEAQISADYLVIGAGFAGLSAANQQVVILDL